MVEQRIIDILVEIFLHVSAASSITRADEFHGCVRIELVEILYMLQTLLKGPNQSHVKNVIQPAGNDVGTSADKNDISQLCKMKDGIRGLFCQKPRRRVQAAYFF